MTEPKIYEGKAFCDDRGTLIAVNDFDFKRVKRFYQIENNSTKVIRAFHGHMKEAKYVFVPKGSVKIITSKILETDEKIKYLSDFKSYVLSSKVPQVLYIPKGHANGFKALEEGTIIQFFSTATLEQSKNDDLRLDWDASGKEIWETKNR